MKASPAAPYDDRTLVVPVKSRSGNNPFDGEDQAWRLALGVRGDNVDLMAAYAWPGNVRELQNLVHSLVITLTGPLISPRDLPAQISGVSNDASRYSEEVLSARRPLREIMAEMERDFLLKAIEVHGSVQRVAELFQVNRSTIFRKLQGSREPQ